MTAPTQVTALCHKTQGTARCRPHRPPRPQRHGLLPHHQRPQSHHQRLQLSHQRLHLRHPSGPLQRRRRLLALLIIAVAGFNSFGIWMLGPALLKFGTEEQRLQWLPRIVRAEVAFCIGMSEPDSGSDLASLQCRAERRGDKLYPDTIRAIFERIVRKHQRSRKRPAAAGYVYSQKFWKSSFKR